MRHPDREHPRDRRKDQLLQQNRGFVLRFPGVDVWTNLDLVPETIMRALNHRRRDLCGEA
jgi:very-short-patch-repair endonuclease